MAKFTFTKHGIKHDPRGAHVTLDYQGKTLIGEVIGVARNEVRGATILNVRHFCGEMWPIQPCARMVDVLERRAV